MEQAENFVSTSIPIIPYYHQQDFSTSFQEIVYSGAQEGKLINGQYYKMPIKYGLVNHKDYWIEKSLFKNPPRLESKVDYTAFGVMTNVFNTRIILVDIDHYALPDLLPTMIEILEGDIVDGIDIIQSSPPASRKWHLWIGLKEHRNIRHVIPNLPKICFGFIKCCIERFESVLRTSKKFYLTDNAEISLPPLYTGAFRKIDGKCIYSYNFKYPQSIEIEVPKRDTINLRG